MKKTFLQKWQAYQTAWIAHWIATNIRTKELWDKMMEDIKENEKKNG